MSETLVTVLLHLAEAGIGDDEVLAFLSTLADGGARERAALASELRRSSPLLRGRAHPDDLATVDQWIELLAALEAWHHLRASIARSGQAMDRRPRPLRAQP